MSPANPFISAVPLKQLYIWVLAPQLESEDPNIDYYYDFTQSVAEYTKTFNELGIEWKWQPVDMNSYARTIEHIAEENEKGGKIQVVFNLCDGDEVNGTPGISVVKLLEEKGLIYTGADEYFYRITTSKIPMKRAFNEAAVPTPAWAEIHTPEQDPHSILQQLGIPVIVKPSVSGGSMGVGTRNVVTDASSMKEQVNKMFQGYRGWQLTTDGIIAEAFVNGPEFTVLIAGSYDKPGKARIYEPVERIFHPSLPDHEKFLSFDRLWEIYEEETAMPGNENFYEYALPDPEITEAIKKLSWDAYVATRGKGYTRVDLRMDKTSGKIYVLEVNAQCGLSEDEDYTSIGAILRLSGKTFTQLVLSILDDALQRRQHVKAKVVSR